MPRLSTIAALSAAALSLLAGSAATATTTFQTLHWSSVNERSMSVDRLLNGNYVAVGDSDIITQSPSSIMLVEIDQFGNRIGPAHYYNLFLPGVAVTAQTVRVASDGNYIVAGEAGNNPFNKGILLVKIDAVSKNVLWARLYEGTAAASPTGTVVRERSGNKVGFVLTGRRRNAVGGMEGVLITTDWNGNQLGACAIRDQRYLPVPNAELSLSDVRENPDRSFTVVGWTRRSPQSPREVLCFRTATQAACGGIVWSRTYFQGNLTDDFPGESLDLAPASAGLPGGYVFTGPWTDASGLAGCFALRTTAAGNPVWQWMNASLQDAQSVRTTFAGDHVISGSAGATVEGALMRVSPAGAILFQTNGVAPGSEQFTEAMPTADGGFAVTAIASNYIGPPGTLDFWVSKTDNLGFTSPNCQSRIVPPPFPDQGLRDVPLVLQPLPPHQIVDVQRFDLQINENDVCAAKTRGCTPRPPRMTLWLPFDEFGGTTALNMATPAFPGADSAGLVHTLAQHVVNSRDFNGTSDSVIVPDYAGINPGAGSFTLDCWIRPDAVTGLRTIVDKRTTSNAVPTPSGYAMFILNGTLWGQFGNGVSFGNFNSGIPVAANAWQHVAMVYNAPTNQAVFYVNGVPSAPINIGAAGGNHSSPGAAFQVGSRVPPLPNFFDGGIDEVEFHRLALTPAQINDVYLAGTSGKCKDVCSAPVSWFCQPTQASVNATMFICNYNATPTTYTYSLTGLGVGPGCTTAGPTTFSPSAGSVLVAPGACVPVVVNIARPAGLVAAGLTSCYQFFVTNTTTGESTACPGKVVDARTWCWPILSDPVLLSPNVAKILSFTVANNEDTDGQQTFRIRVIGPDMEPDLATVSLNGLPPGQPILRTLNAGQGSVDSFDLAVELLDEDPQEFFSVIVEADTDGDGEWEPISAYRLFQDQSVAPACEPDLNGDGAVDQGDVDCMIAVVAGDPSCLRTDITVDPDFNHDGTVDQGDVDAIIDVVGGAPCP